MEVREGSAAGKKHRTLDQLAFHRLGIGQLRAHRGPFGVKAPLGADV